MRIRLVLLDLDDTLLPTSETFWGALQDVLAARYGADEAGAAAETLLRLVRYFGTNEYRGFLFALCVERGLAGDAARAEHQALCRAYKEAYRRRLAPRPGALEVLDHLVAEGRTLGVVSNGRPGFQRFKLERSGLASRITGPILVSGDFPPGWDKPNPHLFEEALKRAGLGPTEAAFVGDRTADVIGARLAGLHAIRFLTHEQPDHTVALRTATPDATVTDVREIPAALARIETRDVP